MLIAVLVIAALALAVGSAALVLAALVWSGERRAATGRPYGVEGETENSEKKPGPLDDERMREGIANLLSYGAGGGRGEE